MTHKEKEQLYQKLGTLAIDMPQGARWCPMVLLSDIKKVLVEEATDEKAISDRTTAREIIEDLSG